MHFGFRLYFEDSTEFVSIASLTATFENGATIYRTRVRHAEVLWQFTPQGAGTVVTLALSSEEPLRLKRVDSLVFSIPKPAETDRMVFLGRDRFVNEIRFPWELAKNTEYGITCTGWTPSLNEMGFFLAGIVPFANIYRSVTVKNDDGTFAFCAKTEFTADMLWETKLQAERVYLCENVTLDTFFSQYCTLLPQSSFPMPKLTGWNSWDYYESSVTPEDIAENVAALKKLPCADFFRYIVIDDGWQKAWGDWRENEKFACGLSAVAENIRTSGFIPGIWIAPLCVDEDLPLVDLWNDRFCRTEDGTPFVSRNRAYLDPTHPAVEAFILDNFRYLYQCGYRLFKIDFVSPLLRVKQFYDPTATPYGVLRELFRKIQAATGTDAVLLGCSLPPECGADIAPAMRIGVDVHNNFPHVEWIAQALTWAWMYNGRICRIDPDFLIVRGEETADEPIRWPKGERKAYLPTRRNLQTDKERQKSHWRNGDQFNAVEAETWANLVAINGGNVFLSDRLSALNETGISIIQNAVALSDESARPVFQKEDQRLASAWLGDKGFLLINWEEIPRQLQLSGVTRPISANKPFEMDGDTVTVTLLPHESFAAYYCD